MLKVIEQLAHEPERYGSVTAATIYHQLEHTPGIALLIDEADNLDLFNNSKMPKFLITGMKLLALILAGSRTATAKVQRKRSTCSRNNSGVKGL